MQKAVANLGTPKEQINKKKIGRMGRKIKGIITGIMGERVDQQ
jgi:hypothetical protein